MKLQKLCTAIRDGLMVEFDYHGKPRVAEIHAIGVSKKDHLIVRAWQHGDEAGWRLFNYDEISEVNLTDLAIDGPRDGYKMNDSAMTTIIMQLEVEAA